MSYLDPDELLLLGRTLFNDKRRMNAVLFLNTLTRKHDIAHITFNFHF